MDPLWDIDRMGAVVIMTIMMLRQYCLLALEADSVENTLGMISLDVSLQVSLLSEGVLTVLADMGSLSCMFLHVDLEAASC